VTEQERANAFVTVLTKLTVGNVALGLALAAGAVLVWGQIYDVKAGATLLLGAIAIGSCFVAVGAGMWTKLEAMQLASIEHWRDTVNDLKAEVEEMRRRADEGAKDRVELHAKLAACETRDRASQARMSRLEKQLEQLGLPTSDFGDFGG